LIAFNTDRVKIWGSAEKALTKKLQEFKNNTLEGEIWLTIENKFLSYEGKA